MDTHALSQNPATPPFSAPQQEHDACGVGFISQNPVARDARQFEGCEACRNHTSKRNKFWLILLWRNIRKRLLQQKTADRLVDGITSKIPYVVGAAGSGILQLLYWWLKR